MEQNKLIITPKTKVFQLLEAFPQLEDVLIRFVPAFRKLKNPVLRNTVAKITTLQHAASIGNVKTEDLINLLRKEVGQDLVSDAGDAQYIISKPGWFDKRKIKQELDIRDILSAGEQPVHQVMADLNKLKDDEIYKVLAPFLPAPLIDKASSLKMNHWVRKESEQLFSVFFQRMK